MHIVHGIAGIKRSAGGTSTFVVELANAQAQLAGTRVSIITPAATDDDLPLLAGVNLCRVQRLADFGDAARALHKRAPIDIIHAHGLWQMNTHALALAAADLAIPFVLATHGMLEPNAYRIKKVRKALAMIGYQRADIVRADALYATADMECHNLRERGFGNPIIVAPPGIPIPTPASMRVWSGSPDRTALFLSRIDPKKNVLGLLTAWAACRPSRWKLVLAGPDNDGYGGTVRSRIAALGLTEDVILRGPCYDDEKASLFRSASLFILPSFSENFGIVVPEALSYGVPAITTIGTPWASVAASGCGWHVPSDASSLTACLAEATTCDDRTLAAMGRIGRAFVEQHYQWSSIASSIDDAYRWLSGCGPKPPCVA